MTSDIRMPGAMLDSEQAASVVTAVSGSDGTAGIYVAVTGRDGFVQMLHLSSLGTLGSVRMVRYGEEMWSGTTRNASGPHTHFEWHPAAGRPPIRTRR